MGYYDLRIRWRRPFQILISQADRRRPLITARFLSYELQNDGFNYGNPALAAIFNDFDVLSKLAIDNLQCIVRSSTACLRVFRFSTHGTCPRALPSSL
jgi:hypothetical protein